MDLCLKICFLGIPLRSKSLMFGDNMLVVDSSMNPRAKIQKRHVALSFNLVRESISANIVGCYFIEGKINPEDVLKNHWGHHKA